MYHCTERKEALTRSWGAGGGLGGSLQRRQAEEEGKMETAWGGGAEKKWYRMRASLGSP